MSLIFNKHSLIGYIFLFFLVLNGGTIIKVLDFNAEFQIITLVLFLVLTIFSGSYTNKTNKSIFFFVSLFLLISLTQLVRFNNIKGILSNQIVGFISIIIIAILVSVHFDKRKIDFATKLNNILKILIIHALISSLVLSLFPTKNILFTTVNGESINPYVGYAYVFFQRRHLTYLDTMATGSFSMFGFPLTRAHGIFWEPGVFATYANIFVFLNLFIFKRKFNIILGVVAVLLSWSSIGIAVLILQYTYYTITIFKLNIKSLIKISVGTFFIFIIGWLTIINLDDKIYGDNSGSSAQRFVDTMTAFEIIKEHPILGIGVDYELLKKQLIKAKPDFGGLISSQLAIDGVSKSGFTNSLLSAFVYFGVPLGMILLISFFKQSLINKKKGLFAIISLISVSSSPILFLAFHFTFIINGLMNQLNILQKGRNLKKHKMYKSNILIN